MSSCVVLSYETELSLSPWIASGVITHRDQSRPSSSCLAPRDSPCEQQGLKEDKPQTPSGPFLGSSSRRSGQWRLFSGCEGGDPIPPAFRQAVLSLEERVVAGAGLQAQSPAQTTLARGSGSSLCLSFVPLLHLATNLLEARSWSRWCWKHTERDPYVLATKLIYVYLKKVVSVR